MFAEIMKTSVMTVEIMLSCLNGTRSVCMNPSVNNASMRIPAQLNRTVIQRSVMKAHFRGFLFFFMRILQVSCLKNYLIDHALLFNAGAGSSFI